MKAQRLPLMACRVIAVVIVTAMSYAAFAGVQATLDDRLIEAAGRGDTAVVNKLLEKGADVNANTGETALTNAALGGHLQMVRLLLQKGPDVNAQGGFGTTALMYAAAKGNLEVVKILLNRGAEVNRADNDGPTHWCMALRAVTLRS